MRRRAKNFLIFHLVRAAITVVGLAPARLTSPLGRFLGFVACLFAVSERKKSMRQLSQAFGFAEKGKRARRIARGVFENLGISAVELCRMHRSLDNSPKVEVAQNSLNALDQALSSKRGVIFVTCHMGNWELMAHHLAKMGYPIATVAKESYDPRFTRFVERFRRRCGVTSIFRNGPGASREMLRTLKSNGVLGVLIDQDTDVPSAFVPFFGVSARTPIGAAALAARSRAPVVVGSIRRRLDGSHIVQIESHSPPEGPSEATAQLTRCIEERVRRHPSQWVWFHERWKTRPVS